MSNPIQDFFRALSGPEEDASDLDLAAVAAARARAEHASTPTTPPASPPPPGDLFTEVIIDATRPIASDTYNAAAPWQTYGYSGTGLHFVREGSAPDIRFRLRVGGAECGVLRPGDGLKANFTQFELKLANWPRAHVELGKHLARFIVDRGGSTYLESIAEPRFKPVPLTDLSDVYAANAAGVYGSGAGSNAGHVLTLNGSPAINGTLQRNINITGFKRVRFYFARPAGEVGTYGDLRFVPIIYIPPAFATTGLLDRPVTLVGLQSYQKGVLDLDVTSVSRQAQWDAVGTNLNGDLGPTFMFLYWELNTGGTATTVRYWAQGVE